MLELGRYIEILAMYRRYRYCRYHIGIGISDIGFFHISIRLFNETND